MSTGRSRIYIVIILSLLLLSQTACSVQPPANQSTNLRPPPSTGTKSDTLTAATTHPVEPASQARASVAQVQFAYPSSRCAYPYSPTNFCDTVHTAAYTHALESRPVNFAERLILLDISTRPEYHQKSLVVLEPETGVVWPFPFDAYSGVIDTRGSPAGEGSLDFSINSSTVCIEGALLVYHALDNGRFCFTFNNGTFDGHNTQYTLDPDS